MDVRESDNQPALVRADWSFFSLFSCCGVWVTRHQAVVVRWCRERDEGDLSVVE